jgi:hypothetical protein
MTAEEPNRCGWVGAEPLYVTYHDQEWGVPQTDSRALFEKIILDLEKPVWITILRKRDISGVFYNFDAAKMALRCGNRGAGRVRHYPPSRQRWKQPSPARAYSLPSRMPARTSRISSGRSSMAGHPEPTAQ